MNFRKLLSNIMGWLCLVQGVICLIEGDYTSNSILCGVAVILFNQFK